MKSLYFLVQCFSQIVCIISHLVMCVHVLLLCWCKW